MSWGIDITGSRAAVIARASEQLDMLAVQYAGRPEADDVLAAKARIVALIDKMDLSPDGAVNWNGVIVKASGSHGSNNKGIYHATFQVTVNRTVLAI